MKKTKVLYWVFTALFAFMMLGSAIPDVLSMPLAVKGMHIDLGYPIYFIPFIGVAKVLGVAALLIPGFPRLREWAYAGLVFDLIGATYSIIMSNQPGPLFMALPLILAAVVLLLSPEATGRNIGDSKVIKTRLKSRSMSFCITAEALVSRLAVYCTTFHS